MKKLCTLCLVLLATASVFAQDPNQIKTSAASKRYAAYRQVETDPPYALSKVKAMVKKIKEDSEMNRRLPDAAFNAMSFDEKFTYCMIHGEDFSQNCAEMMPIVDEEKKIFGYFPGAFNDEAMWSERQTKFMHDNRARVIAMIRSTMNAKHRVGTNLKSAICELNAVELIPDLITIFNRDHKDLDILTVLMILMKEGKYQPFLDSATFKKLYGPDATGDNFIMANSANRKLTIDRAMAFYKSVKK